MALPTGQAAARGYLCALALAASSIAGCTTPTTQLVVVVDTDLAVPAEVATIALRLRRANGAMIEEASVAVTDRRDLPLSLGVVPPEGDVSATILVEAEARDAAGEVIVVITARTGFVAERSLLLRMLLSSSCRRMFDCGAGETCIDGTCESDRIDPSTLPSVRPGTERRDAGFDGGVDGGPMDGGPLDAGPMDGGPRDAGPMDAGPMDGGPRDAGPMDGGPSDAGPMDGGPRDAGPFPPDATVCDVDGGRCECPRDTSCAMICPAGATCRIDARAATDATIRCEPGSQCRVDCSRLTSCNVDCASGAQCIVDCLMGVCSFLACDAPLICPPNLACDVACP